MDSSIGMNFYEFQKAVTEDLLCYLKYWGKQDDWEHLAESHTFALMTHGGLVENFVIEVIDLDFHWIVPEFGRITHSDTN